MAMLRSRSTSRSPGRSHTTTRPARRARCACAPESLESRRLLSAAYDPATGALTVNGSAGNDTIDLNYTGGLFGTLSVIENGVTTFSNFLFNIGTISVHGNAGDDVINDRSGGRAANLYGDAGDDLIYGSSAADYVNGGDGNDAAYGYAGNDVVDGWNGNDLADGGDGGDVLYGYFGDDRLFGGAGNDVMYGEADNDFMDGGGGADVFWGGTGTDTADYSARTNGVTVTLDDLAGDGQLLEGDNVHADVENVNGGFGNDFLFGTASNNYLQGGGGNDVIYGYAGDDVLDGGVGGVAVYSQNTGDD
jgi:Ca2+-binding RTX toxin-like protein